MKHIKAIISGVLCASLVICMSACGGTAPTDKKQPAPMGLSVPETKNREIRQGDIFLSPDGDDKNDGSQMSPVRTPQKAMELAEKLDKKEKVIFVKDGEYNIDDLTLTNKDNNITFFGEKQVVFNGGVTLNANDFSDYKDGIKVLDLKKYNITQEDIGEVRAFGQYNTAEKYDEDGSLYCELFFDGKRMTLARYPNVGEADLRTGKITDNGDSKEIYTDSGTQQNPKWADIKNPRGGTFLAEKALTERMGNWKDSPEVWMFGYFQYDWADSTTPLKTFDEKSITTEYASVYGFKKDMPFYFFNVFEELDTEGEWYVDKEKMLLYFSPPADFGDKSIQLSLTTHDLVTLDNAENITFDGITFLGTRANAFSGTGNNVTIKNCTIKNVGGTAVQLEGNNISVENNVVTATGKAGIVLTGGNRETLEASGNVVTNNLIYDWSQIYQTYQAAVALHGVGGVCSHNEIYNSPHEAITYSGNNHIVEYNVIHDVVLKSSDAGAIYSGRSWSDYGNVIRFNCIYDIGSGEYKPNGIYFDDALSGQSAYGNLLINIPGCGFLIGGGRDIDVTENMIVNAKVPIAYDDRAIAGILDGGWFTHANTPESELWQSLGSVDVQSDTWKNAFPEISKLTSNFDDTKASSFAPNPANSKVKGNFIAGEKKKIGDIAKRVNEYSDISENYIYRMNADLFTADGTYVIDDDSSGFKPLKLSEMGRTYTLDLR